MVKDKIESILATIIIVTYCMGFALGMIGADGFSVVALYVIKKFLDGKEKEKKDA